MKTRYINLGVLLFGLSIISLTLSDTIIKNEIDYDNNITNHLTSAGFWNLTGSPISIDDSEPSKNWIYTASHYDWCSGSGTWKDPYIIENITINGQGLGSCIEIRHSNKYFIIRNCTFYNSGSITDNSGILLSNVNKSMIINNNCSDNYNGIEMYSCNNNSLTGNTLNNNFNHGIYTGYGNNNTLSGNLMNFCGILVWGLLKESSSQNIDNSNLVNNKPVFYYVDGVGLGSSNFTNAGQIILVNCRNSIISGLTLSNTTVGIDLKYCYNITVLGNTLNDNYYGIGTFHCDRNTIEENTANYNTFGISVTFSSNITISENNASHNTNFGIATDRSNNTKIHGNIANYNDYGIALVFSNNNTLSGNIASNNNRGIFFYYSNNHTLSGNEINNNTNTGLYLFGNNNSITGNTLNNNIQGIYLYEGINNALKGNILNFGGIDVSGSLIELSSHKIDTSNQLNNKPIYYYTNQTSLTPDDFFNAGQILLINCNDSVISGAKIFNCSKGIYLFNCFNNTIKNNTYNNNTNNGIFIQSSVNCTLSSNIVNNNLGTGIYLGSSCSNITVRNNTANYNQKYGIKLSTDIFLWNNTASHNQECGIYVDGDYNDLFENKVNNNQENGIHIDIGNNNTLLRNYALNNVGYGIYTLGMYINISGNTMRNCGISVGGPIEWRITCFLDTSNEVNGKPVYFYCNKIGLKPYNFTNAGQVLLNNCSNSVISNVNISKILIGINLFRGKNNTISRCNISNCNLFGIVITDDNNTISDNILNNNKGSGLYIFGENNVIVGNMMCRNDRYGIALEAAIRNSLFIENNISNNGEAGIILNPSCSDNLFYRNIFSGNGINAEDHGSNNAWDNGIIGNYWSDYSGDDTDNNGIGDTPYDISGYANSQDNYPMMDLNQPTIIISYPKDKETSGFNAPEFNVEVKDSHLDKMWYTINNGAIKIFFTSNGTINQTLWNTTPEGNVTIKFYANDTVGNVGFREVSVIKDTSQPTPPGIPGYDLLFLVGIISVMVVIIIKKRVEYLG